MYQVKSRHHRDCLSCVMMKPGLKHFTHCNEQWCRFNVEKGLSHWQLVHDSAHQVCGQIFCTHYDEEVKEQTSALSINLSQWADSGSCLQLELICSKTTSNFLKLVSKNNKKRQQSSASFSSVSHPRKLVENQLNKHKFHFNWSDLRQWVSTLKA